MLENSKGMQLYNTDNMPRIEQPFRSYVILDFEATCERKAIRYPNEIIEFPLVLISQPTEENSVQSFEIKDELQLFVKPVQNPRLTEFCTELTGIGQDKVDQAPELPQALVIVHEWLQEKELISKTLKLEECYDRGREDLEELWEQHVFFTFVTDGPWDFRDFLFKECTRKKIPVPFYFDRWVNLRDLYANFYHCSKRNITRMLENLGMTFEGRSHSGVDDARNIGRVMMRMIQDGCVVYRNESMNDFEKLLKRRIAKIERQQSGKPKPQPFEYVTILELYTVRDMPIPSHLESIEPNLRNMLEDSVIEMKLSAVNTMTLEKESEFHVYIKPNLNRTVDGIEVPNRHLLEPLFETHLNQGVETLRDALTILKQYLFEHGFIKPARVTKAKRKEFPTDEHEHVEKQQQEVTEVEESSQPQVVEIKRRSSVLLVSSIDRLTVLRRDIERNKLLLMKHLMRYVDLSASIADFLSKNQTVDPLIFEIDDTGDDNTLSFKIENSRQQLSQLLHSGAILSPKPLPKK